ncbi:Sodium:dicarboxylate symporter [Chytridium lagenaria]|nr:Sodium:dicarboxylate symporter [Chytridium lagenaria]
MSTDADVESGSVRRGDGKTSWLKSILTSLPFYIIIGTIIGILLGSYAPEFAKSASPTSNLFMRPIQFVVFPLMKAVGRVGWKAMLYFEVVTTLALFIGLVLANLLQPGRSLSFPPPITITNTTHTHSYASMIDHLTPRTWSEMANGEMLQVLVTAILFGCAATKLGHRQRAAVVEAADTVMKIMFGVVNMVIWMAPIGVTFSIANAIATTNGFSVLTSLLKLVAVLHLALLVLVLGVFLPICLISKTPPLPLLHALRNPLLLAYTTGTSESALPTSLTSLTTYGVPPHISSFILPLGYCFNLTGSTLYLSLASLFALQASTRHPTLLDQLIMCLELMVASKGVAGVRGASLVLIMATVEAYGGMWRLWVLWLEWIGSWIWRGVRVMFWGMDWPRWWLLRWRGVLERRRGTGGGGCCGG